jgi:hypothetical protein
MILRQSVRAARSILVAAIAHHRAADCTHFGQGRHASQMARAQGVSLTVSHGNRPITLIYWLKRNLGRMPPMRLEPPKPAAEALSDPCFVGNDGPNVALHY